MLRVESDEDHLYSVLSFSFTLGLLQNDRRTASLHLSVRKSAYEVEGLALHLREVATCLD